MKAKIVYPVLFIGFSGLARADNMLGYGHMYGFGFFGFLIMLLFWGALIYLIYLVIKNISGPRNSPLEILKGRYAKGQISKKKFEEMKKDLRR